MSTTNPFTEEITQKMIKQLVRGIDLEEEQAYACIDEIMSGQVSEVRIAAFLTSLSIKKETQVEILGCVKAMRKHSLKLNYEGEVFEIVGTGGDGSDSFNISTTAAFIIAAAGVKVAKHGNRAVSSKSGAADCLEALGVKIDISPEQSRKILEEIGICFLFAPIYHSAMRYVAPVRKELGIRTIFNILGPLANPAGASKQMLGVYHKDLLRPMAKTLMDLGVQRGMAVYGEDGLDEISLSAPTHCYEFLDGREKEYEIVPEDFGLQRCEKADLKGFDAKGNAEITRNILRGMKGAKTDATILNAGASLYIAGTVKDIKEGIELAQSQIINGRAYHILEEFIRLSNQV